MRSASDNVKQMVLSALFAALTAAGAMITIPFGPVPFTMQTLVVFMSGMVLGARWGAVSQVVYVIIGLCGMPVFSGFSGGIGSVFMPSFGFLIAFPLSAAVIGWICSKRTPGFLWFILAGSAGMAVQYLIGAPYMALILRAVNGLEGAKTLVYVAGLFAYLPTDIIKVAAAALLGRKLLTIINTFILRKKNV